MGLDAKRAFASALLALSVALAGCANAGPTPKAKASASSSATNDAELSGRVLFVGGPYEPHARNRTHMAVPVIVYTAGARPELPRRVAVTRSAASDGRFSFRLPPGFYVVVAKAPHGMGVVRSHSVTLTAGSSRTVTLYYNIR